MPISSQQSGVQSSTVSTGYKLQTLLRAQPSFGGVVGAPVVFFIGGFVYNIFDSDGSKGVENIALSLAYGMYWMTIPHVAVIANTLLASNNPWVLQGLIGNHTAPPIDHGSPALPAGHSVPAVKGPFAVVTDSSTPPGQSTCLDKGKLPTIWKKAKNVFMENAYDGNLEPVALWDRGRNKQRWYIQLVEQMPQGEVSQIDTAVRFGLKDWSIVLVTTIFLLGIPFIFAFTTAYITPQRGLSCRSLTHLVYFSTQVCQTCDWCLQTLEEFTILKLFAWLRQFFAKNKTAYNVTQVYLSLMRIGLFMIAVSASIAGTIMNTIGVWDTCLCEINVWYWIDQENPLALVSLSSVTKAGIAAASNWNILGGLASGLLALVAVLGWWHQRGLRDTFIRQAECVNKPKETLLEHMR
ncbi:unnamed protein product [Discula destructiva]